MDDRRRHRLLRWVLAVAISALFTVVGLALLGVAAVVAIALVADAVQKSDASRAAAVPLLVLLMLVGVAIISRARPWAVRRLSGRRVGAVPAPLRSMWNSDGGAYSGWGGDGGHHV
jgi:hypothetical protein